MSCNVFVEIRCNSLSFIRVHKSFSINLNKMNHLSGNQITVDSHNVPIGQTYKAQVLKALNL